LSSHLVIYLLSFFDVIVYPEKYLVQSSAKINELVVVVRKYYEYSKLITCITGMLCIYSVYYFQLVCMSEYQVCQIVDNLPTNTSHSDDDNSDTSFNQESDLTSVVTMIYMSKVTF